MDDKKLATLMTGKAYAYETSAPDLSRAKTVLSVRGLTRAGQYEDISLDIHAGEIVGLTGLLGSGRTEFALSLFGMNPPTSGEIRLNGKAAGAEDQRPGDRRRHRLRLGGSTDPRAGAGAADRLEHSRHGARQAHKPVRAGAGSEPSTRRAKMDRGSRDQGARTRTMRSRRFRAAINSASFSPSGWRLGLSS